MPEVEEQSAQVEEETAPAQPAHDDMVAEEVDEEAPLAIQDEAQLDAQEELLEQQQSLEWVVYEQQVQEQGDLAADNLTVPEDNMFEMQESVQGLVVSVEELWNCVKGLTKRMEESAKEAQIPECGCSPVTAEYVHKYARTYAQEYTRQYIQTFHKLLQAKQPELVSAAEAALIDACDIDPAATNETVDELGAGCDAEGVILELPAFVTAQGDFSCQDTFKITALPELTALSSVKTP